MDNGEILSALNAHRAEIEQLGVVSLALFGSVARNEARPESDVDILIEVQRPMSAFRFIDLKQRLEEILQRRVDLVTARALKPRLRSRVLQEAVLAFGHDPAA